MNRTCSTRTSVRGIIAALCATICAASAVAAPVPTVNAKETRPAPGVFAGPANDAKPLTRVRPPIDTVPPAPMPQPPAVLGLPPTTDAVLMHDAETGETKALPAAFLSGEIGGEGGTTYFGADGGGGVGAEAGFGTMSILSNATRATFPYRVNCKLLMRFVTTSGTDKYFVCSGTMMDSEVVLTAAHCVFNRDADINDWAAEIWVYPAWANDGSGTDNQAQNYGEARGTSYIAGSGYVNSGDWDRDNAAVRVTRAVGQLTGSFGWAWGFDCATIQGRTYNNAAYPSEDCNASGSLHNGRDMIFWSGDVDACPDNQMQLFTTTGCYTAVWGGMSGSSMYYISGSDRFAHGVCSTSNRSTRGQYCKMWEQFSIDLETFKSNSRGSSFDLQALNVQLGATSVQEYSTVAVDFLASNPTNVNPGSQSYGFKIFLSSNSTISTADTVLYDGSFTWDFPANSSVRVNVGNLRIPCGTTAGTYWIGAIIDTGAGGDTNSGNNDTQGWDAPSITVTANPTPAAPTNVNATTACNSVSVSWTAVSGATSYNIYRNTTNASGTATLIGTDTASPYTDATTVSGTNYYYWVRATDGCDTSGFSLSDGPVAETNFPAAPTGVGASDGTSCASVSVSYNAVSNATTYDIYRNTVNSSATATLIGSDLAPPYTDATAVAGTTYFYWVKASNICGDSGFSASTTGFRNITPAPATGLSASSNLCTTVDLSWNAMTFASSYDVYRNTVNNSATATLLGNTVTNSFTDSTPVVGTTYFYWVRSKNLCGTAAFSTSDSGGTVAVPAAPASASASDGTSCTETTVTWPAQATQVHIFRNTVNNAATATQIGTAAIAATSFSDLTGVAGTTYFYYVATFNACQESARTSAGTGFRSGPPAVPANVQATDGTICTGVTVTWNTVSGATSYKIFRNTVNNTATAVQIGSTAALTFNDNTAAVGITYNYWVKSTGTCGDSGFSTTNTGIRGSGAAIVTQPLDTTALVGSPAFFSVVAGGGSNSYQWSFNGLPLSNGGRISGANTPNLTINPVQASDDNAVIRVAITNPCGNANSNPATLRVGTCPCAADFDGSGGTPDFSDITAFFNAWLAGDPAADTDCSGGTPDGTDIDLFFRQWLAGGC